MWRAGNVPAAILLLGGIIVACLATASPAEDPAAPRVDRSDARRAHRLVEQWVRHAAVPDAIDQRMPVTGLSGVRVTLWRDGISHGSGEAYPDNLAAVTDPADSSDQPVDLAALLADATRQALAGVRDTLTEVELRARMDGAELDDEQRRRIALDAVARELLVSVQVGQSLEAIQLFDDADTADLYAHFAPGHHGLRVTARHDARRTRAIWPAATVERNITPQGQLIHLLAATGHEPQSLAQLARSNGPRLARFDAIHVVRPSRDWPIVELVRGSVLLPLEQVDEPTLDSLASRLGRHLQRRFTTDGLVRGTYLPTRNDYDPPLAAPEEAALAAYALIRHAAHLQTLSRDDLADAHLATARPTLAHLGQWVLDGADGQTSAAVTATASLTLLSLVDLPARTADQRELRDRLGQWLTRQLANPDAALQPAPDDDDAAAADAADDDTRAAADRADTSRETVRALAVAALAALYEQRRDADLRDALIRHMHELAQTSPDVASLGWRLLAHQRATHLLPDDAARAQQSAARALGQLGQTFLRRQVTRPPALGPADVTGGYELRRLSPDAPPAPDWRSSYVLMFQAIALRDPHMLDDDDLLDWLLSTGLASRFLAQLIVDEPAAYSLRSPADALGGVQLAPWDNRLTVAAQAMTLLAVTELQQSLTSLVQRGL